VSRAQTRVFFQPPPSARGLIPTGERDKRQSLLTDGTSRDKCSAQQSRAIITFNPRPLGRSVAA